MARLMRRVALCVILIAAASLAYGEEVQRPVIRRPAIRREVIETRRERAAAAERAAVKRTPQEIEQARENRVDARQAYQQRRIEHGISKGYLTADEIAKLDAQQKAIASMEASFKADNRLTRDEMGQLRNALNTASVNIWAEKHDSEGGQMPTYRLGKNVFAKSELTGVLQQEDLSGTQARQLVHDFHRTIVLKRKLATEDLTPEQRATFQAEYNELLNKYFEIR